MKKIFLVLFGSVLIASLVLGLLALTDYLSRPEAYRFGTEVGGWLYDSVWVYVGYMMLTVLVSCWGLISIWVSRSVSTKIVVSGTSALFAAVLFFVSRI